MLREKFILYQINILPHIAVFSATEENREHLCLLTRKKSVL